MRHLYLLLAVLLNTSLLAQTAITVNINHLLGGEVFENEKQMKNDINSDYMIDRLQYYLSQFTVIHDGGQETIIPDSYVLIDLLNNRSTTTSLDFGTVDASNIEGLKFYFGVDEPANHADPAAWPDGHPLAPKSPSMHWGWLAGYRFIALEGKSGPAIDQEMQFHCIGNQYYKELSFEGAMISNDAYHLELNADYHNLLNGTDLSQGVIIHGGQSAEIQRVVTNLVENTFTAITPTNTGESPLINHYTIYPNPSTTNEVNIHGNLDHIASINIYDMNGRLVEMSTNTRGIILPYSGVYHINILTKDGSSLIYRVIAQ